MQTMIIVNKYFTITFYNLINFFSERKAQHKYKNSGKTRRYNRRDETYGKKSMGKNPINTSQN